MVGLSRREFIAASAATSLVAGSGLAHAQGAAGRVQLNAVLIPEPPLLNSGISVSSPAIVFSSKVYDGLCELDFDFKMQPALAESWETGADGKTWTFRLRRGVKWHDGKDFTSADVAFSMMEVWKKLHPRGSLAFRNVQAAETPDSHTVILKLSAPIPHMPGALTAHDSPVLPKHVFDGTDVLRNPANNAPIGTGAFKFVEWVRGSYITVEKNPDYWDKGKPHLDRIVFRFIPDPGARAAALETRTIHLAGPNPVPLSDVERLRKLKHLRVETRGGEFFSPMVYLQFNLKHPIMGRKEVRHALAHAIDQSFIADNILFGFGKPATGLIPPSMKDFYTADVPRYEFDIRKAEKMLDDAGLPRQRGIRFEVQVDAQPIGEHYTRTGEFVRESLNRIGIRATLRNEDVAAWNRRIFTQNDYAMSVYGAVLLADPTIGLQRFIDSRNIKPGLPFSNAAFYESAEVDRLLDEANVATDQAKRRAAWQQIQRVTQADLPILSLTTFDWFSIYDESVEDAITTPYAYYDSWKTLRLKR